MAEQLVRVALQNLAQMRRDHGRRIDAQHLLERRLDREREEALHVARAEAIQIAISLDDAEGIARPAIGVEGNGVGVTAEHEPTRSLASRCNQICFSLISEREHARVGVTPVAATRGPRALKQ